MSNSTKGFGSTVSRWLPTLILITMVAVLSGPAFSYFNTANALWHFERHLGLVLSPQAAYLIHLVLRKSAHFTLYGLLFLALFRGPLKNRTALAVVACIAVAALDEFHQSFLPQRTASLYDVMLDTSGVLFSWFAYHAWFGPW